MARKWRYLSIAAIVVVTFAIAISVGEKVQTAPNSLEIICQIESVTSTLSNNNLMIPVNVTNFVDSIAGFQLWVNISEPSLIRFKKDSIHIVPGSPPDTQYFAKFDTSGTRISGWEYLQARILDDTVGALLNIIGTADNGSNPIRPPLNPGGGRFIKLFCETKGTLGDSLGDSAVIKLIINQSTTRFSDQHGDLIAYSCSSWVDTVYSNCAQWVGPNCVSWFDTTIVPRSSCVFDTLTGLYIDGKIGFLGCKCGDADGNGLWTISDAVYLITYIFAGGPAPNPSCRGDADGNGLITISDAVYLISYIFGGGPAPHCP